MIRTANSRTKLLVLAGILALFGALSVANQPADSAQDVAVRPVRTHGGFPDALDANGEVGVPLDEAMKRLGRRFDMPDPAIVGDPVKAVVDNMSQSSSEDGGLLVKFSSGIKLKIHPGSLDFAKATIDTRGAIVDGVEEPYLVEIIGGRKTWVAVGGTQTLTSGDYAVPTLLTWNADGYTYTMEAGTNSVSLDDLRAAAESIP